MTNNTPAGAKNENINASSPMYVPGYNAAPRPVREFSKKERLLVFVALIVAILCDRLLFSSLSWQAFDLPYFSAIFWITFLVIFYAVFWEKLKDQKLSWLIAGFIVLLCVWNILYDYTSAYGILTLLVIPCVTMAHVVLSTGSYKLKDAERMAVAWLCGWFVRPFSAIPMMFGAIGSMTKGAKKATVRNVTVGLLCSLAVLVVIVPLLGSADLVFGYYLQQMLDLFDVSPFVFHSIVIMIAAILFYSFLWNAGFSEPRPAGLRKEVRIDTVVSSMVLGAVVTLYVVFCALQFTYLFAGAGLPANLTYSEYAREGFAQLIAVCSINLGLFGIFLRYGKQHRATSLLLLCLLCLSGVMLVSGFVRLNLYITAYGLTGLRLFSAWFILYLAVVLALSFVRMLKEQLPLIALSALILLGWFTVFGYANPDALIMQYNLQANGNSSAWVEENRNYIYDLSDDALLVLLSRIPDSEALAPILQDRLQESSRYNVSSRRLERILTSKLSD